MNICCPKCDARGTIPDHEVPEAGRFLNCPRCNEGFTVNKPRSGSDAYLVDTCPACGFSTFGDETFGTCPKCGVAIKIFVERQREEQLLKHNQELLGKKLHNTDNATQPAPDNSAASVSDFIENLHPVNIIGWGVAAAGITVFGKGAWDLMGYDGTAIQAMLTEQRGEQVSAASVFLNHALPHWAKIIYGVIALIVSALFLKRLKIGLRALGFLIWATIFIVPFSYIIKFIFWILMPIPHTLSGYLIEIMNILLISALAGVPLYFLERFLHERKITSIVKL